MNRSLAARAASVLLRYPDEEVLAATSLVREVAAGLPGRVGAGLLAVAEHRMSQDAGSLAREYVELFDLRRRCCLYLSYYTDGDTRRRGVALVEFTAAYKKAGLEIADGELPDFLPAVLELAAVHDHAWRLLGTYRVGLDLLVKALAAERSIYREAVAAVRALLPPAGPGDDLAARRLAESGPPAEMVGLEGFALADSSGGRR